MPEIELDQLLNFCVKQGGSDLILKSGTSPIIRLHGDLVRMKMDPLSPEALQARREHVLDILRNALQPPAAGF